MTSRPASAVAVASVVVTALLVVGLVTWAASIGPDDVLRGDGPALRHSPSPTASSTTSAPASPAPTTPSREDRPDDGSNLVRVLALLVNIATLLLGCYLLLRLGSWGARELGERRRRRRRTDAADRLDFPVLEPPAAIARELLADADEQRRVLLEGSPRNAVVACWHRFETQAAAAGLERRPWETSSEYTMRVLDLVDAYQPAVSRLGALYREARFSGHELTEEHRREALDALGTIHRTIGVKGVSTP